MPARSAAVVLCLLLAAPVLAAPPEKGRQPEWWRDGGPRLRANDSRAAALLQSGIDRSATLRALAECVEASNVFVYVGMKLNMGPGQAGGLTFVGHAIGFRYLRISINPALGADRAIATLGHELQHVIEVIEHPEVTSEASLSGLYRRIGKPSRILQGQGWETDAAQTVGASVHRELGAAAVAAVAQARKTTER
jgi:hypothetical protein